MGRRKLDENSIRKLQKIGGDSLGVTIPIEIVRKLKLRGKQKVIVTERRGKIIITDWEK